jgi:hypothetical protein
VTAAAIAIRGAAAEQAGAVAGAVGRSLMDRRPSDLLRRSRAGGESETPGLPRHRFQPGQFRQARALGLSARKAAHRKLRSMLDLKPWAQGAVSSI